MVSIREYYLDWRTDEPATFTIECLDEDGPAPRVTGDDLAAQFADAASSVEHSMGYWNDYMLEARADGVDNAFAASQRVQGLGPRPRRALLGPRPRRGARRHDGPARGAYWSLHLYTMGWFEPIDPSGRITSRNHLQTTVGPDGTVRAVVAHHDPGVPNWLDTAGRPEGLLTLRWFWPMGDGAPQPQATVVPFAEVAGPPGAGATAEMAERRRHMAWRFRT